MKDEPDLPRLLAGGQFEAGPLDADLTPRDPIHAIRSNSARKLPARFYTKAECLPREGGFALLLDGKLARSKKGRPLAVPDARLAAGLAAEWQAQAEVIDPARMPLTRFIHAAIDYVAEAPADIVAEILRYAASDATCYRAAEPARLVALEAQLWDPVLAHMAARYGARLHLAQGIGHVTQPPEAIAALARRMHAITSPFALAALHGLTSLAGSALIAVAVADGLLDAQSGFAAAELEADFEVSVWGEDAEAKARREGRQADFLAAATILAILSDVG